MTISANKVVSIHYTLTDNQERIIDTSDGREPLVYLHGVGQLISGLERELLGKAVGDQLKVSIPPSEGFGERDQNLLKKVPLANFPTKELQPGMQFQTQTEQGNMIFTVIEVGGDHVVVDGNHPLAGIMLHFKVEIIAIRQASPEEIEYQHVHGSEGDQQ